MSVCYPKAEFPNIAGRDSACRPLGDGLGQIRLVPVGVGFGWGRNTVATGLNELRSGLRCRENFAARGRHRSEQKDPQLAADIRAIVEPHTYADPELKSARRYTNLSAAQGQREL